MQREGSICWLMTIKKKCVTIISALCLTLCSNIAVTYAETSYKDGIFFVAVGGDTMTCNNTVYDSNNVLYYPLRDFADILGMSIGWDESSDTVTMDTDTNKLFRYFDEDLDLYGYKDYAGNIITEAKYQLAYGMSDGLALVFENGSYGYIDDNGETALPFVYGNAYNFSDGAALVSEENAICGGDSYYYIDTDGKRLFDKEFYPGGVGSFSCGYAPVMKQGRPYPLPNDTLKKIWTYMDKTGEYATDLEFDSAYDFNDDGYAIVFKDGKYGMINTNFEYVVDCIYDTEGAALSAFGMSDNSFTDFKIEANGKRIAILDGVMVVRGKTYLSAEDIGRVLGETIKEEVKNNTVKLYVDTASN